jgi:Fungal cellulose binding domain
MRAVAAVVALLATADAAVKLPYVRRYKQCGGLEWTGGTECVPGYVSAGVLWSKKSAAAQIIETLSALCGYFHFRRAH